MKEISTTVLPMVAAGYFINGPKMLSGHKDDRQRQGKWSARDENH